MASATAIHNRCTFEAPLAPVYRAFARTLATAGSFGNTAIDGYICQLQADNSIIGHNDT